MRSTRLPGKVIADLAGQPMVTRVVARARAAERVDDVWVACSDHQADEPLVSHCRAAGIALFRGAEGDVLGRYLAAAAAASAEVVVRLTADCPLIDPQTISAVVDALGRGGDAVDYASNVLERTFPRGLDVEAFSIEALSRMDRLGRTASAREHVTLGPRVEHPQAFSSRQVQAAVNDSDLRWTVDTAADLEHVRRIYRELDLARGIRPYRDVVRWCREHPKAARRDQPEQTWDPRPRPS